MAEEVLVAGSLTDEMVTAGAALVRHLDAAGIPVNGAFWLLNDETEVWRLYLATAEMDRLGPRKVYAKVADVVDRASDEAGRLALHDITVLEENDPRILAPASAVPTAPDATERRRCYRYGWLEGIAVPDAMVYRAYRVPAASRRHRRTSSTPVPA